MGWVGSLNHQPVVGRAGSGRVTHFDNSMGIGNPRLFQLGMGMGMGCTYSRHNTRPHLNY